MKKRALSMFLSVCMLLSLFPSAAFAAGTGDYIESITVNLADNKGTKQAIQDPDAGTWSVECEVGDFVNSVEIVASDEITLAQDAAVTVGGSPYGALEANGSTLTITPSSKDSYENTRADSTGLASATGTYTFSATGISIGGQAVDFTDCLTLTVSNPDAPVVESLSYVLNVASGSPTSSGSITPDDDGVFAISCAPGDTVSEIRINVNNFVTVEDGTTVLIDGQEYGKVNVQLVEWTATFDDSDPLAAKNGEYGTLLAVVPNTGAEVAGETGTFTFTLGSGSIKDFAGQNLDLNNVSFKMTVQEEDHALDKAEAWKTSLADDIANGSTDWDTVIRAVWWYEQAEAYVNGLSDGSDKDAAQARLDALTNWFPTVTSLSLAGSSTSVFDISTGALTMFTGLTNLDLSDTGIADSGGLAYLTSLESLDLSGNENFTANEFGGLAPLSKLKSLDLSGTGVADIGGLSGTQFADTLEELDISGTDVTLLQSVWTNSASLFPSLTKLTAQDLALTSISGLYEIAKSAGTLSGVTWDLGGSTLSDNTNDITHLTLIVNAMGDGSAFVMPDGYSKITFDANGGSGEMDIQVVKDNTASVLAANAFTNGDGVFLGWNTGSSGDGTAYGAGGSITISGDTTLYAQWDMDPDKALDKAETWKDNLAGDIAQGSTDWDTVIMAVYWYGEAKDYVDGLSDGSGKDAAQARLDVLTDYFPSVTSLSLADSNTSERGFDISTGALTMFTGLTSLDLSNTGIKDSGGLAYLTSLESLDLSGNPDFTAANFGGLAPLVNLTSLNLSGTGVTDIGGLSGTQFAGTLEELDISGTDVTLLQSVWTGSAPLFPSLTKLTAHDLALTSISGLYEIARAAGTLSGVTWDLGDSTLSDDTHGVTHLNLIVEAMGGGSTFVMPDGYSKITVNPMTNGTVVASANVAVPGTTITLVPQPDNGYELDTIEVADPQSTARPVLTQQQDGTYTFDAGSYDVEVDATFKKSTYTISVASVDNGLVEVSKTSGQLGDSITITMDPDVDYVSNGVTVETEDGTSVTVNGSGDSYTFVMPAASVIVTGAFLYVPPVRYDITVNAMSNGSVTASLSDAVENYPITLTPVPGEGYELDTITVKKVGTSELVALTENTRNGTWEFSMPASDVEVDATFKLTNYVISVTPSSDAGTITSSHSTATMGTQVTITVVTNAGYQLTGPVTAVRRGGGTVAVTDNGDGTYTFTMPASNVTVDVPLGDKDYEALIGSTKYEKLGGPGGALDQAAAGDTIYLFGTAVLDQADVNQIPEGVKLQIAAGKTVNVDTATAGAFLESPGTLEIHTGGKLVLDGSEYIGLSDTAALDLERGYMTIDFDDGAMLLATGSEAAVHAGQAFGPPPPSTLSVANGATLAVEPGAALALSEDASIAILAGGTMTVENIRGIEDSLGAVTVHEGANFTYDGEELPLALGAGSAMSLYLADSTLALETGSATVADAKTAELNDGTALTIRVDEGTTLEVAAAGTLVFAADGGLEAVGDVNVAGAMEFQAGASMSGEAAVTGVVALYDYEALVADKAVFMLSGSGAKVLAVDDIATNIGSTRGVKDPEVKTYTSAAGIETLFPYGWEWDDPDYTITVTQPQHGSISSSHTVAKEGDTVTLTIQTESGYGMQSLTVTDKNGEAVAVSGSNGTFTFTMPKSAVSVSAVVRPNSGLYLVNLPASVVNGKIIASAAQAAPLTIITLTPTPDNGYVVDAISATNARTGAAITLTAGANGTYTFEMPSDDVDVAVSFKVKPPVPTYKVTLPGSVTGGTITADKSTAEAGATVTITASANSNYSIGSVSVKETVSGTVVALTNAGSGKYTFTMPAADVTVTASFSYKGNNSGGTGGGGGGGSSSDDGPTYYRIVLPDDPDGGSVKSDKNSAYSGQKVTLTVKPSRNWALDSLTATYGTKAKEVELTDNGDGTYTFRMPSGKVTVEVSFEKLPQEPVVPPSSTTPATMPFTDVPSNAWYYNAVLYVYTNGLMDGTGNNLFSPGTFTTRGMMATLLYRIEREPTVSGKSPFTDVANDQWYSDAVIWANNNGIVLGYGNGKFGPSDPVTREQMVTMLFRYAQYKGYGGSVLPDLSSFSDGGKVSDWAEYAMRWAVGNGIIDGVGGNMLSPNGTSTRAELAQMFTNFLQWTLTA